MAEKPDTDEDPSMCRYCHVRLRIVPDIKSRGWVWANCPKCGATGPVGVWED